MSAGDKYWVASCRGCDFAQLERAGFRTFYPAIDDYVFLKECPENRHLLQKQDELHIKFLRSKRVFNVVTEEELALMDASSKDDLVAGCKVVVIDGPHSGLEGEILSREGEILHCVVKGWRRSFNVELQASQVSMKEI